MSKYSPAEARALYEEMADNTDIVGHAACGDLDALHRFQARTSAVADDFTLEEDPVADADDGPPRLRFHVASPWHALIHLSTNNRGWLEGRQGSIRTPLIYRGHRDARWSVLPSLFRKEVDRGREERRLLAFGSIAREILNRQDTDLRLADLGGPDLLSDTVLEATAQHYGIKTSLLDFTSDEAVAVWFACQGGSKGDTASVFALPLAVGALFEVRPVLCHPLAMRPYRQHGLFVRDSLNQLKRLLIEVRFPIDSEFRIRRDRLPSALFLEDEWWSAVVAAADNTSPSLPTLDSSSSRVKEAVDESLLHLLQMLMELATFDVMRDTSFNHDVIAQIASLNSRLLLAFDERCRSVGRQHFRGTMGQFVVPQLLDHLKSAALRRPVVSPKKEVLDVIDTFKKWLPFYVESHGGLLSHVPTDAARVMLQICRERDIDCELHPQGQGTWLIAIKGARTSS